MHLHETYEGAADVFEGERVVVWRSLPAGASVTSATVTVTPRTAPGAASFEEVIFFADGRGSHGATVQTGANFVEVDFHARRTLAACQGDLTKVSGLQVDVGGLYVAVGSNGAIGSGGSFAIPTDHSLPGLTVSRFKLEASSAPPPPRLTSVTVKSIATNVSVRLGMLAPFWTRLGELVTSETSPDFASVLQAFIAEARPENGFFVVPIVLHSDTLARLDVELTVDYVLQASALPSGLADVTLPFAFDELPTADAGLSVVAPRGAIATARGTVVRVRGAFEETRIAFDPLIRPVEGLKTGSVGVSAALSHAQPFKLPAGADDARGETLAGIDLLLATGKPAKLQLDLRGDLDGKPDGGSLLGKPVTFEVAGTVAAAPPSGIDPARWSNVPFVSPIRLEKGPTHWLVLQSLDEVAVWKTVLVVNATGLGRLLSTDDGALSWRPAVAGMSDAAAGIFRLRSRPEQFTVPIALQVGETTVGSETVPARTAVRVPLDQFAPLGRVDFTLDPAVVAETLNAAALPDASPPLGDREGLVNGDFEEWIRVGDDLGSPVRRPLDGRNPSAMATTPDGSRLFVVTSVASDASPMAALLVVDSACGQVTTKIPLSATQVPKALVIRPDGRRGYLAINRNLQIVDLVRNAELGSSFDVTGPITALAVSPDGRRLYVATSRALVHAIDVDLLEQATSRTSPTIAQVTARADLDLGKLTLGAASALATSPDGTRLFVTTVSTTSAFDIFDTATFDRLLPQSIAIGGTPHSLAVTPDGSSVVVADGSTDLKIVATTSGALRTVALGAKTVAVGVAIPRPGKRVYVALVTSSGGEIRALDLAPSRRTSSSQTLQGQPTALAATPDEDQFFMVSSPTGQSAATQTASLLSSQVGERHPLEWNVTGSIAPLCLGEPFHRTAVLGLSNGAGGGRAGTLAQTVPVTKAAVGRVEFWAVATDVQASLEVQWLDAERTTLRVDQIRIEREPAPGARLANYASTSGAGDEPSLVLHQANLAPPVNAVEAEFRFSTPSGVLAMVDLASFVLSAERLASLDLRQRVGWTTTDPAPSMVTSAHGPVELMNASNERAVLAQALPVRSGDRFRLEVVGRVVAAAATAEHPRIELRSAGPTGPIGDPLLLDFDRAAFPFNAAEGELPAGTDHVEIRIVLPADTTLELKRVSFETFAPRRALPITFVAEAPGTLTITDFQVGFVDAPPVPTPSAGGGGAGTGDDDDQDQEHDDCFCHSCGSIRAMTKATTVRTTSGRSAVVASCSTCDGPMVLFRAAPAPAGSVFAIRGAELPRLIVRHPVEAPQLLRASVAPGSAATTPTIPVAPSLRAIAGIGATRERLLVDAGIDTVEKLAAASPDDLSSVIKGVALSRRTVEGFIAKAQHLVAGP